MLKLKFIFLMLLASCLSLDDADQNAFQAIYDSLGGASWTNQPSLDDLCSFTVGNVFVTCDAESESIVEISLPSNNLVGVLPDVFSQMTSLTTLILNDNQITGALPDFSTSSLTQLILAGNPLDCPVSDYSSITTNDYQDLVTQCANIVCATTTIGDATFGTVGLGETSAGNCTDGFTGSPIATCTQNGLNGVFTSVNGSCQAIGFCPEGVIDNANYTQTEVGQTGSGVCQLGWTGTPTIDCTNVDDTPTWSQTINNPCQAIYCTEGIIDNANYTQTQVGQTGSGVCQLGWTGTPTIYCDFVDNVPTWSQNITNPCQAIYCTEGIIDNANYTQTQVGQTGSGVCQLGWTGAPTIYCDFVNNVPTWSQNITSPCQAIYCNQTAIDNANYNQTQVGQIGSGICQFGWTGTPTIECTIIDGVPTWSQNITNPCQEIYCNQTAIDNANYNQTQVGQTGLGVCQLGWIGAPTIYCDLVDNVPTWSQNITSPCQAIYCNQTTIDNANYNQTQVGQNGTGVCQFGWTGTPTIYCDFVDNVPTWSQNISNPCQIIYCTEGVIDNANYTQTQVGQTGSGVCQLGWTGTPTIYCDFVNNVPTWSQNITNPCQPTYCPEAVIGNANYTQTQVGQTGSGVCQSGFAGNPTIECLLINGVPTWSQNITSPCQGVYCPSETIEFGTFPTTQGNSSAQGTCQTGYSGNPTRFCQQINGELSWTDIILGSPCIRSCPVAEINFAIYHATPINQVAPGRCLPGYLGSPTLKCGSNPINPNEALWDFESQTGSCSASIIPEDKVNAVAAGILIPLLIIIIAGVLFYLYRRHKRRQRDQDPDAFPLNEFH